MTRCVTRAGDAESALLGKPGGGGQKAGAAVAPAMPFGLKKAPDSDAQIRLFNLDLHYAVIAGEPTCLPVAPQAAGCAETGCAPRPCVPAWLRSLPRLPPGLQLPPDLPPASRMHACAHRAKQTLKTRSKRSTGQRCT